MKNKKKLTAKSSKRRSGLLKTEWSQGTMHQKQLMWHETDGGAIYLTDNHNFSKAKLIIRMDRALDIHEPSSIAIVEKCDL